MAVRVTGAWEGKLLSDQSVSQYNLSDLSDLKSPILQLTPGKLKRFSGREEERGDAMATFSTSQEGARSKVCAVCKCDSESYHLNYGASTCFRLEDMSVLLTFAPSFELD